MDSAPTIPTSFIVPNMQLNETAMFHIHTKTTHITKKLSKKINHETVGANLCVRPTNKNEIPAFAGMTKIINDCSPNQLYKWLNNPPNETAINSL